MPEPIEQGGTPPCEMPRGWKPWAEFVDEATPEQVDAARRGSERCAECGRPIGDRGRLYSTGIELIPFCGDCATREFG